MTNRIDKIFFGASVGLYRKLVWFDYIKGDGSNLQFVNMVSAMRDLFSKEKMVGVLFEVGLYIRRCTCSLLRGK
jgi:hypothetical protein